MRIDASGIKELKGKVIKVKGALSLEIEIEDLEIGDVDKVTGIEKGKFIGIWVACLIIEEKDKIEESKEFLKRITLGKKIKVKPDSWRPNKQANINGHVYLIEGNRYLNKLMLQKDLVKRDINMQGSKMCQKLLKEAIFDDC